MTVMVVAAALPTVLRAPVDDGGNDSSSPNTNTIEYRGYRVISVVVAVSPAPVPVLARGSRR